MVDRNLIRSLEDEEIADTIATLVPDTEEFPDLIATEDSKAEFDVNNVVEGRIVRVDDDSVLVDIGFKSEGTVPRDEWDPHEDPPEIGDKLHVLIEDMEDEHGHVDDPYGMIMISKRKAEKIRRWNEMMETVGEGEVVTGTVTRKIKGGLLVDIGVPVFLPASQVDIRRPSDIGDYIGRVVQCEVLKKIGRAHV